MSNVVGISGFYHDSAACVYHDGVLIAAAEEERFTRQKHDSGFPANAAAFVLESAGLSVAEIDYVVWYEKPLVKFERILAVAGDLFPRGLSYFVPAMSAWLSEKLWVPTHVRKHLGYVGEILYGEHHLSHAASAFYCSPFEEAAVITADGVGEWASTTIGRGAGLDLSIEKEIRFPHSLGLLYSLFTSYLGFAVNDGEYKVMGMAAYGRPRLVNEMRRVVRLLADGSFSVDTRFFDYGGAARAWTKLLVDIFGPPCGPHEEDVDPRCADIAASLQAVVEESLVALANEAYRLTGSHNLCLAGGVFLNVLANSRILAETPFDAVYVPPAPGDSGGAVGCAAYVAHGLLRAPRPAALMTSRLGPSFDDAAIGRFLDEHTIPYRKLGRPDLLSHAAGLIAEDKVIGWFQGPMEFGPRALGSRSILANPRNPGMKDLLNAKVKHREPFRPFAPAVPREDVSNFFVESIDSPFMSFVAHARPEVEQNIPAVIHVDGTSRVQTVDANADPLFHDLLRAVERLLGLPVVLNTSFNLRGEPIVCTPEDAFRCFSDTNIDALFLGSFVIDTEGKRAGARRTLSDVDTRALVTN